MLNCPYAKRWFCTRTSRICWRKYDTVGGLLNRCSWRLGGRVVDGPRTRDHGTRI